MLRPSLALIAGLAAVPTLAHADIITALAGAPSQVAGGYAYTYDVELSGGQIDPVGTTDGNGNPIAAQFGTIYDFGPIVADSSGNPEITYTGLLGNFTWTFNNTDAPATNTSPNDNPNLLNVRFIYNGTDGIAVAGQGSDFNNNPKVDTVAAGDPSNLGTFTIVSPYSQAPGSPFAYDGETYKATNNTEQANIGFLAGPLVPVPEPATFALLGTGLLGLGLLRRRA